MYNPLVSVIIPNYCHAKYLDQRIQSVLNQTYQNFEVIILDDASPDDGASKAVIEKYRHNPHVSHVLYNEQNSGSTFKQWNKGFELAKGDYIWIAESDDYCELKFVEKAVEALECDNNNVLVFCWSQLVDEKGNLIKHIFKKEEGVIKFDGKKFIKEHLLYATAITNVSSAIFKRHTALSISKDYMNFVAAGDRMFYINLAEKGNIVRLNYPYNYFRQHKSDKVSPKKLRQGITDKEDYFIVCYLEEKGYIKGWMEKWRVRYHFWERLTPGRFDSIAVYDDTKKLWSNNGRIPFRSLVAFIKVARYGKYLKWKLSNK